MKFTGHVSCAVIAATPIIYYQSHLPISINPIQIDNYDLLMWTGFWGVIPDIDIILQRFLPIKHRGVLTHSLWSCLVFPGLLLAYYVLSQHNLVTPLQYLTPLTIILAFFGFLMHILGDSLTKSGVPLLYSKQKWHFPGIGGYATFDNPILNLIPLICAGYLIYALFGMKPETLKRFGKFSHYTKILTPATSTQPQTAEPPVSP